MSGGHRTPYADDALRVEQGTQPEDIQEFVQRRALEAHEIHGVKVWNFNNHTINEEALRRDALNFRHREYVIPYQASGVWAYMATLLPAEIREAEILAYRQQEGEYMPFPNYFRHSDDETNHATRASIRDSL
jgi:hypothetical protein